MSTPLVKDLVLLLVANRTALGIPTTVRMDRLMESGDSISVAMNSVPKTEKEYINGAKVRQASFGVLAVTSEAVSDIQNLAAVSWLDAIGELFEGMNNFSLSSGRTIIEATQVTMPTIVSRTDTGRITYVLNISIKYREEAQ